MNDMMKSYIFFGFVFLSVFLAACVSSESDGVTGEAVAKKFSQFSVLSCDNQGDVSGSEYVFGTVLAKEKRGTSTVNKNYADKCVTTATTDLVEYRCDSKNKIVMKTDYKCEVGCSNGKCKVPPEVCADGVDNDFDNLIDCADTQSCANDVACQSCEDDDNSFVDLNEDGGYQNPSEFQTPSLFLKSQVKGVGSNGVWDVVEDYCESSTGVTEGFCIAPENNGKNSQFMLCPSGSQCVDGACSEVCSDGVDNNADGLTDCADNACTADASCLPATVTGLTLAPAGDGQSVVLTATTSTQGYVEFKASCAANGEWVYEEQAYPSVSFAIDKTAPYTATYSGSPCKIGEEYSSYDSVEFFKANTFKSKKEPCYPEMLQQTCDGSVKRTPRYYPCTGVTENLASDCAMNTDLLGAAQKCGVIDNNKKYVTCYDNCVEGTTFDRCVYNITGLGATSVNSNKQKCLLGFSSKLTMWSYLSPNEGCPTGTSCAIKKQKGTEVEGVCELPPPTTTMGEMGSSPQ